VRERGQLVAFFFGEKAALNHALIGIYAAEKRKKFFCHKNQHICKAITPVEP
jgi:hypothetical protein